MAEKIWQTLSNELAAAATEAGRSVVAVVGKRHPASGVLLDKETVITTHHSLGRQEELAVMFANGERATASVAGRDSGTDLAALRLTQAASSPPGRWGEAAKLRIGELVLALARSWRGNVVASAGVISGLVAGPWRTWRGGELEQFIRPDVTLYPGFSGGPLVSSAGDVVGINTAGLHRSGITIPAATVRKVGAQLIEKGRVERPYLGLAMQPVPLPESLRNKLNLSSTDGLLAVHVEPGAPADKGGALLGDILVALDGKNVGDTDDVQEALRAGAVGKEMEALVIRGGLSTKLKIRLEPRPAR